MSVGGISESLQPFLHPGRAERVLAFRSDDAFTSTLTLGQIIKGKVLRHYEGGRYGVSFGGQEKIVDSASPLNTGELLYGRVIGIDDKVLLQRIADGQNPPPADRDPEPLDEYRGARRGRDAVAQLFARYRAELPAPQLHALNRLQSRMGGSPLVAVSALILNKLNIAYEPVFLRAIHRVLQEKAGPGNGRPLAAQTIDGGHASGGRLTENSFGAGRLSAGQTTAKQSSAGLFDGQVTLQQSVAGQSADRESSVEQSARQSEAAPVAPVSMKRADEHFTKELRSLLSQLSEHTRPRVESAETSAQNAPGKRQQQERILGQWLLNTQSGGSVCHRLMQFPLWFGERLVEVDVALFSQLDAVAPAGPQRERPPEGKQTFRYRKVFFSLHTDNLGHVEIQAQAADRHLQIDVITDHTAAAEQLGAHLDELQAALSEAGWRVDAISYRTRQGGCGVIEAVVEHHITRDSLSRLM